MKIDIPYFQQPDNSHCFQACLKMILKYFFPKKDFTWKELDKICKKKKDKWTWPFAALVELKKMGLDVKYYDNFDFILFSKNGYDYLRKKFPSDVAETQINMSDMESEIKNARIMIDEGIGKNIKVKFDEIENLFEEGFVIKVAINSCIIHGMEGYASHSVVITDIENDFVTINDPDPNRGSKDMKVNKELFIKSWHYPKDENYAILLKK